MFNLCRSVPLLLCLALTFAPLSASAELNLEGLTGHTEVISTTDITPRLGIQTSRSNEVPLFAALSALSGREAVDYQREHGIEDPSVLISQLIGRRLGELKSLPVRQSDDELGHGDSYMQNRVRRPEDIAQAHGPNKLVVSGSTQKWSFAKFATKYQLQLIANVQIVDTNTGKRLEREDCITPLRRADAPEIAILLEDNASALKAELDYGARYCAGKIANELFGDPEDIFLDRQ